MRLVPRASATAAGTVGAFVILALTVGCGDDSPPPAAGGTPTPTVTATPSPTPTVHSIILFSAEGEDLNAYDVHDGFRKQAVVFGGEDEHAGGYSLNGEVCFTRDGSRVFAAGDDAGQPEVTPGWSVFQLLGDRVGEFTYTHIAKLTLTYQAQPDNYGCAFLSDGRLLTTDIGNNRSGPGDGQLTVWFPPFDEANLHYCKLDITLGTAGGIYVDADDTVYVASARLTPAVYRYPPPFPTSDDAAGGCGQHDGTGAPMADSIVKDTFIRPDAVAVTPNAVWGSDHGTFYVTSILNGAIGEYDGNGKLVRRILTPPHGEVLGPMPYSTGTPLGLVVDSEGSIYYADLGLVNNQGNLGPGNRTGTVRRIRFENGLPQRPETIDSMLRFPDGVGVLEY
jgi:sugar lactone lactonase YvrE